MEALKEKAKRFRTVKTTILKPGNSTAKIFEYVMVKTTKKISGLVPEWIKQPLREAKDFFLGIPYYGEGRYCPVCEKS